MPDFEEVERQIFALRLRVAVKPSELEVYYICDGRVVGVGRIAIRHAGELVIQPLDEAAKEFFSDDYTVPCLGFVYGMRYLAYDGEPWRGPVDEPENRHKGTVVVGKIEFDLGLADQERFGRVEGFGAALVAA